MVDIVGKRNVWYSVSGILIAGSFAALAVWGLKLGIDFTGGSIAELSFTVDRPSNERVQTALAPLELGTVILQPAGEQEMIIRSKSLDEDGHQKLLGAIRDATKTAEQAKPFEERSFESIGPVIGEELKSKSVTALVLVLLAIIGYIAFAFRKVSEPVASWKYGVCAVIALFHDVAIPSGIFAVLGHVLGYEIDTLFVTAVLTVLGFSVHDTIVVFDRIRENLTRRAGKTFEETVNISVNETMTRSVNTSLTVLLVLLAVYLFGGESTKHFVLVLILGVVFGTYSSIFVASPLLVDWYRRAKR